MPLLRRKRVLAAKVEATPGTAETLTAAEAVFNVFDSTILPTIEFDEREGQSNFSPLPGTLGPSSATCTFSTELIPGSGALPAWASTFLPACGYVVSTATYTPRTEAPGSNVKTLTIGLFENGKLKMIRGAMGTAVIRFTAGRKIMIDWTFTGIWVAPTDSAILAPTYPTLAPMRFVSSGLSIGSWTPRVAEMTLDLGNQVILREDSTDPSGYSTALITGRRITGTLNPESELVATEDYYGAWLARTEQAFDITLSSGGIGVVFSGSKLQFTNVQEAERNQTQIDNLEFVLNRNAALGDDEMSIVFDHTP